MKKGYDLGGAECPHDPSYTVMDIQDIPDYAVFPNVAGYTRKDYDFIKADLRKIFHLGLDPRPFINCGQLVRYLDMEGGHLNGEPVSWNVYRAFGHRLAHLWDPYYTGKLGKPQIVLFDHAALLEWVLMGILDLAHEEGWPELDIQTEWVNPPDEDLPSDWSFRITLA